MTFWRRFRTDPFVGTLVLGLLMATWSGSTQAQEPKGGARSLEGALIHKLLARSAGSGETEPQRVQQQNLEANAAQPLVAPANDNFANAVALPVQQGSVSGTNVDATAEPGEPEHAGVAGISSVWYTFTPDQTGITFLDTFDADFPAVLAVYTGDAVNDLAEVTSGRFLQVAFLAQQDVTYRVAVDGVQGAQGNFTLNIERTDQLAPDNDDFEDAIALEGRQGTVFGVNAGASAEPGEPAHAGSGGVSSVWYTFTPNDTGVTFVDTFDSDFDTLLAVYTGDQVDDLTEVASNDDAPQEGLQSRVAFLAEAGVTYRIAVDGFQGRQGIFALNFRQTDQLALPENDDFEDAIALEREDDEIDGSNAGTSSEVGEPVHAIFGLGNSVWYTITSNRTRVIELRVSPPDDGDGLAIFGPAIAVYQGASVDSLTEVASTSDWIFDLTDDGTFDTSVPLAFLADAGVTYRIAVDNTQSFGIPVPDPDVLNGGAFMLEFDRANRLPPDNDDFEDAIALEGRRGSVTGSSAGATREAGEQFLFSDFFGTTRSVWYSFTSGETRLVTVDTFGSEFDTVLYVFAGDLSNVAFNDDADNGRQSGRQSEVAFLALSGATYFIRVDGFNGARGDFTLNFDRSRRQSPANDDFADARRLIGSSGLVNGVNVNATTQPNEPVPSDPGPGLTSGRSVWWRWRAPFTGEVTFTTAGSTFDTILAVYQGPTLSDLSEIASNDQAVLRNGLVLNQSLVTFEAEEGELYHILVDGFLDPVSDVVIPDQGTITLAWTPGDALLKREVEAGKTPPGRDDPKS